MIIYLSQDVIAHEYIFKLKGSMMITKMNKAIYLDATHTYVNVRYYQMNIFNSTIN